MFGFLRKVPLPDLSETERWSHFCLLLSEGMDYIAVEWDHYLWSRIDLDAEWASGGDEPPIEVRTADELFFAWTRPDPRMVRSLERVYAADIAERWGRIPLRPAPELEAELSMEFSQGPVTEPCRLETEA